MNMITKVVGLGVGLLVTAYILPDAIMAITEANTTGWNTGVSTMFTVLIPIVAVIGIVLYLIKQD